MLLCVVVLCCVVRCEVSLCGVLCCDVVWIGVVWYCIVVLCCCVVSCCVMLCKDEDEINGVWACYEKTLKTQDVAVSEKTHDVTESVIVVVKEWAG